MKLKKKGAVLLAGTMAMVAVLSACSNGGNGGGADPAQLTAPQNTASATNTHSSPDAPITVTMALSQAVNTTFPEGESMENNLWTRTLLEESNIQIKSEWTVDESQYTEKLNVAIASGDLPDVFQVSGTQLQQLVEADMLADLTDVYKENISPLADGKLREDGSVGLDAVTFDGKLLALPYTTATMDGSTMLWVRKDWLNRLGLPEPKTIDDVLAISKAFKNDDPDGDGKDDTVGIGFRKDLFSHFGGIKGFVNGFHAYSTWIEDEESGQLVNGAIQPEMKEALTKLQEMYKSGEIDQEFSVKGTTQLQEDIASGRVGMVFGAMAEPLANLNPSVLNDPEAVWECYPLPSVDDQPAKPQTDSMPPFYFVVSKQSEHPEAIIKMMNLNVEKWFGETADAKFDYDNGFPTHKYFTVRTYGARKNLDNYLKINEALKTGDTSGLNPGQLGNYNQVKQYLDGDKSMWNYAKIFGPEGSLGIVNKYVNEDLLLPNSYQGIPTSTIVKLTSTTGDITDQALMKIILGDPIESFDTFVENWKKLGGDEITAEVNDWYAKHKS
ncbi:extracellular solute-binding protein [Paenibacillus mendelii]|uniref:Extracellular solute-binding protein n=1 Tax=Paenibacillus mendelii TaxID=206163 RepID=A0ABV6J9M0_9BACL|nr:extracellular solute-binding protein [Paenibacillus mendelii]MCQ6563889.1 extracellular solute-binding protein [Paenibacillus mendelii]